MKKYFFLDRGILQPQGMDNVQIRVCHIKKDKEHNPLFTEGFFGNPSLKWEVRYDNAYPNVIYDSKYKKYRVYYTLCSYDEDSAGASKEERTKRDYRPAPGRIASLGYAESDDGITWNRPSLGLVEFEGSKDNNMVFRYAHGTGIFLDEAETDQSKRYKLVTKVEYPGGHNYMAVNFSEDGIHWGEMIPWPKYNPQADSHNFPFRDKKDGKFKMVTRTWKNGVRISSICESIDFINWSEPKETIRGEGFESQVYSMPVFQYEGLYLGLASMFHEGNRSAPDFDTVDCELKYASTTDVFDSVAKGQYIIERGEGHYPTGEFDCGCIYSGVPVEDGDKLWFYYMGGNGQHTNFRETSFGRGYLEKDKFAYYEQDLQDKEAVLPTAFFHFYGEAFSLLADKEDGGSFSVALYDRWNGQAYEGYDFKDCIQKPQENGYTSVSFAKPLLELGIRSACIVIRFSGAKIYALAGDLEVVSIRY